LRTFTSGCRERIHSSGGEVLQSNVDARMNCKSGRQVAITPFSRLTNACSKKLENHAAMVSLYFRYCVHQTLRVTPAMEAGIANHVWSIEEIVGFLDRQSDGSVEAGR